MKAANFAKPGRSAKPPLSTSFSLRQLTEARRAAAEAEQRYLTLFNSAPVGISITTLDGRILAFNRHLCAMAGMTEAQALAMPARQFYARKSDRSRLMKLLRRDGQIRDETVLFRTGKDSTKLCIVSVQVIRLGRRKALLNIVQDITDRERTERHLQGLVELLKLLVTHSTRQSYLRGLVRLLQRWCGCRSVGIRLLDSSGRAPYAAQVGFPAQFVSAENRELLRASHCACLRMLGGFPRPNDNRRLQASFFCDSASRFAQELNHNAGMPQRIACVQSGFHSLAHAPIRHGGRIIGTIHLADPRPSRFGLEIISYIESAAPLIGEAIQRFATEESLQESESRFRALFERHHGVMLLLDPRHGTVVDANPAALEFYGYSLELLKRMKFQELATIPEDASAKLKELWQVDQKSFGVQQRLSTGEIRQMEVHASAMAIRNHKLAFCLLEDVTERRALEKQVLDVAEKERQRIGQDLHDSVGGKLGGAAMIAQALAQRLRNRGLEDATLADEVVQCLSESIAQTRSISRGLCPVEWTGGGLASALAELAREKQRQSGVPVHFVSHEEVQTADVFTASHLFFIAQEAVNNALRHAQPKMVVIRLQNRRSGLVLDVEDDGTGLRPQAHRNEGLGLQSMTYRADQLGASLVFTPGQNGGTCMRCMVPRQRPNHLPNRKGP